MKNLLALTICLLFSCAFAQDRGFRSEGREFYLGYIQPSFTDFAPTNALPYFKVYAVVSSYEDNEVAISYFDELVKKEGLPAIYNVKARQTVYIPLDHVHMRMKNPGDIAGEFKSCHVVSKRPVSVQFFSTGANAGGSYLALPVHSWGNTYTVASYDDLSTQPNDYGAGCFLIIAAYDGTNVTIIPTTRTGGGHVGVNQGDGATGQPVPYTISLNRGQTWLVKSQSPSGQGDDDISASIVKADKPIAVIAGHEDATVGYSQPAGSILDSRDYMVEQMIPVEFWHRTGNIVIPMVDNPSTVEPGDVVRMYVSDKLVPTNVTIESIGNPQTQTLTTYRPIQKYLASQAHFSTDSGKFMLMQYDQRAIGATGTNTSPSMMSIVPRAHWRTAYQFSVPANVQANPIHEQRQSYFITVITPTDGSSQLHHGTNTVLKRNWTSDSTLVSFNGSTKTLLNSFGTTVATLITVRGHSDLQARIFRVTPGTTYHLRSPLPFMVYHYGNRSFDPVDTVGDFHDEYYFSYALPVGMSLSDYTVSNRLGVTVDTLCGSWRICATDSNQGGGIRYVTLIDDEDRDLWPEASRKFSNCRITSGLDVNGAGEFHSGVPKQNLCFDVEVIDPSKPTYAPIVVYDKAGNYTILELRMPATMVMLHPSPDSGLIFSSSIMQEHCKEFTFINLLSNSQEYTVTSFMLGASSHFTVGSMTPPLGSAINPGDTLRVSVCFKGPDSLLYRDNLVITTNCLILRIPLTGQASVAKVLASDKDFGTVLFNSQRCADAEVRNVGVHEFIIKDVLVPTGTDFTFAPQHTKNRFPIVIPPGGSHKFWVCYEPKEEGRDTAKLTWLTDIPAPFHETIKTFSILTGKGTKPGVKWDREKQFFRADSTQTVVERVNLVNTSTADAEITVITINGTDAAEFFIVATEHNTNPPTYQGTVLPPGDTMWVDVYFKLDMTQEPIDRIHRALLQTSAKLDPTAIKTVILEAGFGLADVAKSDLTRNIMIRPNPARDRVIIDVNLEGSEVVSIKLFDVLGREINAASYSGMMPGWNSITLDLQALARGTYIAIITVGEHVETRSLIVE